MSTPFTVACIQLNSGRELGPNIETTQRLVREARRAGAAFILTPENTTCIEPKRAGSPSQHKWSSARPVKP